MPAVNQCNVAVDVSMFYVSHQVYDWENGRKSSLCQVATRGLPGRGRINGRHVAAGPLLLHRCSEFVDIVCYLNKFGLRNNFEPK